MRASKPSIAITRSRTPEGTTVNASRVGPDSSAEPADQREEERGGAKRECAGGDGRAPGLAVPTPPCDMPPASDAVSRSRQDHRRRGDGDGMAEQDADRGRERQGRQRPQRGRPAQSGNHGLPPQREVDQAERASRGRRPLATAVVRPARQRPGDCREIHETARLAMSAARGHRHAEEAGEIDRHDEGVAWPGDEAWHARAEAERRGRTQEERRHHADADAREEGDRRRAGASRAPVRARTDPRRRRGSRANAGAAAVRRREGRRSVESVISVRCCAPRQTRTARAAGRHAGQTVRARGRPSGTAPWRAGARPPRR